MKKIIRLGNKTYEYEAIDLNIDNGVELCRDDAREILFKAQDVMGQLDVKIFLTFGTLLGAIREKDFIKGDLDVDVYVKNEERLFNLLPQMKSLGLELIRAVKHKVYSFVLVGKPGCYIDFYILRKPISFWSLYCSRIEGTYYPDRILKDGKVEFLGREFNCPSPTIDFLKFCYGETWNIPISKMEKEYRYDVASHYYYVRIIQPVKDLLKQCFSLLAGRKRASNLFKKYRGEI